MPVNPLQDLRPDQAQWARMNAGLASPLWLPFMVAASAGVAWWTYANWARLTAASWGGSLQPAQPSASEPTPQPSPPAPAAPEPVAQPANDTAPAAALEAPEPVANDDEDDDVADAIDAAYAANLGPVPPPHDEDQAPARRARPRSTAKAASKAPAARVTAKTAAAKAPAAAKPAKAAAAKSAPARAAKSPSKSADKPKRGGKKGR